MHRQLRFALAQAIWMLCLVLALSLLDTLRIETFVILSFVGLLVIVELTAPLTVVPRWRVRVRWVVLLGLLAVAYIMMRGILRTIPPGTF